MKCLPMCSFLILFVWFSDQHVTAETAKPPNVLFILTEDQGSHLSLLGTPGLKTPYMDSLARRGCFFSKAFVTYPVCSASKAAIYTGLYNHTNGILNNTHNYHKPPSQITDAERERRLYQINRVKPQYTTLIEWLKKRGYYQGVTHKLHVAPVEKFPYDEFLGGSISGVKGFLERAKTTGRPWFLLVNLPETHRPYPNSDRDSIRVRTDELELPSYLPDTPAVRKDWSEYLAGVEKADRLVGQTLAYLDASGETDETIVIFMSDHGPTYPHGKMTIYDLGLSVPLAISGPGLPENQVHEHLVCGLDLFPTLIELIDGDLQAVNRFDGKSLAGVLKSEQPSTTGLREFVFGEISNRGPLPNDGIQERSVNDGRWKLIYRERVEAGWRQVNADSREFKVWGNRTYRETLKRKSEFPRQYQVLLEMDPQTLGGSVPRLELYDLQDDPDEMNNLVAEVEHQTHRDRLLNALAVWVEQTRDDSIVELDDLRRGLR